MTGTGAAGCVGTPFSDSPRWEVALPLDPPTGGQYTYTVDAAIRGNGTSAPLCAAYAVNPNGTLASTTSWVGNRSTSLVTFEMGTLLITDQQQYMFVACDNLGDPKFSVGMIYWY